MLRILIADDESIIRLGLKKILEEAGHKVVASAPNGKKALELARCTSPDLAILDIKMPEMDGLEVADVLRKENPIPVIILTAYGDKELVERAREAEAMAYLVKPVKEAELLAALEIAVKRFEEWDKLRREKENLEEAFKTRELVEEAKRILMKEKGMKESEAYLFIHRLSRDSRRPMKEIAQEIIERYGH
ncbi:MAG: response regulator [Anaerolineae bacterium]|nr:response regulator [Anaerolineae bacterium]MDW8103338.1 response regulator [Anaerolineae bacterium]